MWNCYIQAPTALTFVHTFCLCLVLQVDKVIDDINETNEQMKQMQDVFATPTGIAAGGAGEGELGHMDGEGARGRKCRW